VRLTNARIIIIIIIIIISSVKELPGYKLPLVVIKKPKELYSE